MIGANPIPTTSAAIPPKPRNVPISAEVWPDTSAIGTKKVEKTVNGNKLKIAAPTSSQIDLKITRSDIALLLYPPLLYTAI